MEKGADLLQALVDSEQQPSRGQARKTVASNAVTINGEKQADPELTVTRLVHGEEGLQAAKRITECLFSGSLSALSEADFEQLAQDGVPMVEMEKGADLMQALVDSELQPSRGQARKTIASNAITINGEKQSDPEYFFKEEDRLFGRFTLLRRGKKNYCLICWK